MFQLSQILIHLNAAPPFPPWEASITQKLKFLTRRHGNTCICIQNGKQWQLPVRSPQECARVLFHNQAIRDRSAKQKNSPGPRQFEIHAAAL